MYAKHVVVNLPSGRITRQCDIFEMPALVGPDTDRRVGILLVQIVGGRLCDPRTELPYRVDGDAKIMGWGLLNGPCKCIVPTDGTWSAMVPNDVWAWMSAWARKFERRNEQCNDPDAPVNCASSDDFRRQGSEE